MACLKFTGLMSTPTAECEGILADAESALAVNFDDL